MTTKVSSIDDVILAIVTALDAAVSYPVYDGPPSNWPDRTVSKWVSVGADDLTDQENFTISATMDQEWTGLGPGARYETIQINCVAVAKSTSIAAARSLAMSVIEDAGSNLAVHPTDETYGALVSSVAAVRSHNITGGAIVHVNFVITANARLT